MENSKIPPFLPGDKVVFIGPARNKLMNYPELNTEVVTILRRSTEYDDGYVIFEYQFATDGSGQCFHKSSLRPVSESKFRAVTFEKILEETPEICVN